MRMGSGLGVAPQQPPQQHRHLRPLPQVPLNGWAQGRLRETDGHTDGHTDTRHRAVLPRVSSVPVPPPFPSPSPPHRLRPHPQRRSRCRHPGPKCGVAEGGNG